MAKKKVLSEEERLAQEEKINNEIAQRTARFDQSLKEEARKYGINPDNFDTEEVLEEAIEKYKKDNNIEEKE